MQQRTKRATALLRFVYGIVPIVAGLDKFFNILVNWEMYVSPLVYNLGISAAAFMGLVGVVEIAAGILVFYRPVLGSYIVAAWLVLVSLNLLTAGFYDIAVRDLVLAVGAFVLAELKADEGADQETPAQT